MENQDERHSILSEFEGIDFGDKRLSGRLAESVTSLENDPQAGFPEALGSDAGAEGFYRFIRNKKVNFDTLYEPHLAQSCKRVAEHAEVLALHDTTDLTYNDEADREGLGRMSKGGQGFYAHTCLGVVADDSREPLGVLGIETWMRPRDSEHTSKQSSRKRAKAPDKESERWVRLANTVEDRITGSTKLIHVMDREADIYPLFCDFLSKQMRFVIRVKHNRNLFEPVEGVKKLKQAIEHSDFVATRTVPITRRGKKRSQKAKKAHPPRDERVATLSFRATTLSLKRPQDLAKDLPKHLELNLVHVLETNPPDEVPPVEWLLYTSEPIDTPEAILRVVDFYRARWTVEEYFKALKTGCSMEKRQLRSFDTLLNALALFIPIAWDLLRLRTLARTKSKAPASTVLTKIQIKILRKVSKKKLPPRLSVYHAFMAIGRMGGLLASNGEPGWLILMRGWQKLITLEEGFRLAEL